MAEGKRKICIATSTRADWGILSPLAGALRARPDVELQLLATNMHLLESYGATASEIEADGFVIDERVAMATAEGAQGRAEAMGQCLSGTAAAFGRLRPDAVVILGDRFEMLAVASAAAVMRIPVIHISGGETTGGAIDDAMRHAITQLASLHLVSAEPYRRKVIGLGASPDRVVNTGSLGVWNMVNQPSMSREELAADLGIDLAGPFAVATFHPATLDTASPGERCQQMLAALDRFPALGVIITYPNNDTGSEEIIAEITRWAAEWPGRAALVKSLGMRRYLAAIREAAVVVGNSSSGIIEVPSVHTPVVNIGIRQQGRLHGDGVIDCGDTADEIAAAIATALSDGFRETARSAPNPYYAPDTLRKTVDAIAAFPR